MKVWSWHVYVGSFPKYVLVQTDPKVRTCGHVPVFQDFGKKYVRVIGIPIHYTPKQPDAACWNDLLWDPFYIWQAVVLPMHTSQGDCA